MLFLSQHNIQAKYKKILKVLSRWKILLLWQHFWFSLCEQDNCWYYWIFRSWWFFRKHPYNIIWKNKKSSIYRNSFNLIGVKNVKLRENRLDIHSVQWLGNRFSIIQNTKNLTKVKPANAPQSGSGLDFLWMVVKPFKGGFRIRNIDFHCSGITVSLRC